jgi:Mn-dependent DtxR family transcriptional regulator
LLFLYDWEKPIRIGDIHQILQKDYNYQQTQQNLNYLIKKLRKKNLISWQPHSMVELQESGSEFALHLAWHRHLLERFFEETLDLPKEQIHKEALRITPIISCNFINALVRKFHNNDCNLKTEVINQRLCVDE